MELEGAKFEVDKLRRQLEMTIQENAILRDAIQKMSADQGRLFEDKRELEELIERLNDSINYHKQTQANFLMN